MSHGAREFRLSSFLTNRVLFREVLESDAAGLPSGSPPIINLDYSTSGSSGVKSPFGFNSSLVLYLLDNSAEQTATGILYVWINSSIESGAGPATLTAIPNWSQVAAVPFTGSTCVVLNDLPANQYTATAVMPGTDGAATAVVILEQHSA